MRLPLRPAHIACLYIPDFRLQVALRQLGGEPDGGLALVDAAGGRREIVAASEGARLDGVRRGMTSVAATAIAPEVTIRPIGEGELADVHRALEAAVRRVTPQIESTGSGVIYASYLGLERRYGEAGEGGFLDDLRDAALGLGLPARLGMGSCRFVARCAAVLEPRGCFPLVIPGGGEADFLAPLSLRFLPEAAVEVAALESLGLRTLGELADLPPSGLARRFGAHGTQLQRLARGHGRSQIVPSPEPRKFLQRIHTDSPIASLEPLLFLLRRPLGLLLGELDLGGLAASEIRWALQLEDHPPLIGCARAAAPSAGLRLWSELVQLDLERKELRSGVVAVSLEACDVGPSAPEQSCMLGPRQAPPGALSRTLGHLATALGRESFGALRPRPSVFPEERQEWVPFGRSLSSVSGRREAPEAWVAPQGEGSIPSAAYRAESPPMAVEVQWGRQGIRRVTCRFGHIDIHSTKGPWDISTSWWGRPLRRRYFQVSGRQVLAWLYFEPEPGAWFLVGWLD